MTKTIVSSRQFNQDTGKAKKAAASGPVFITDRGRPAHVLMTFDEYRKLTGRRRSIAELLAMPGADGADLDTTLPRDRARAAELT